MDYTGSRLGGNRIKLFFFLHWEKLAMGLALVGFASLIYFGRVRPFSETSPQALNTNVENASRYIDNSSAWDSIAEYRQGNEVAVDTIQSERTVNPGWYQVATISGTPLKTRGLRSDPEIKAPLDVQAKLLVGSIVTFKAKSRSGQILGDYWSELDKLKIKGEGEGEVAAAGAPEDEFGKRGFAGARGVQKTENEQDGKKDEDAVPVYPIIQAQEEQGVAIGRMGINAEQHTTKVVSSVCVTALFPHQLQSQEFERAFLDSVSYNAKRDKPQYVRLEIQRRRMVNDVPGEWEDITDFVTQVLPRDVYAGFGPEVVEETFVDPVLTLKLPPFVFGSFLPSVAHAKVPKLKVVETVGGDLTSVATPSTVRIEDLRAPNPGDPAGQADGATTGAAGKSTPSAEYKLVRFFDMFDFKVDPTTKVQYRFRVWVADPNMYSQSIVDKLLEKDPLAGSGEQAQGAAATGDGDLGAMRAGGKGGKGKGGGAGAGNTSDESSSQVDFLQLDPAVRDRLRKLETEKFAADQEWKRFSRASEWSTETNWVGLSNNESVMIAGNITVPNPVVYSPGVTLVEGEPEVDVAVRKWDPALQVPVSVAQKVVRGSLVNFRGAGFVFNPILRKVFKLDRDLVEGSEEATGVNFSTQSFIVDLLGGQKMPYSSPEKSYVYPPEVIVMNLNGEMTVQNLSEEKRAYRHSLFADDEGLVDANKKSSEADAQAEKGTRPGRGRQE